jgi:hypothetical protein
MCKELRIGNNDRLRILRKDVTNNQPKKRLASEGGDKPRLAPSNN